MVTLISDFKYKELFQTNSIDFIHLYAKVGSELEKDVFSLADEVEVYAFEREDDENDKSYFVFMKDVSISFLTILKVKYNWCMSKRGEKSDDVDSFAVINTVYFIIN